MDVHLWAKVGTDGKIQSVQSTCAQSPFDDGPMFAPPLKLPDKDNIGGSDKFVPYMEKKRLAHSLGTKVDEMAKMMHELEALYKTDELQKKLIQEYEHKIASLTEKVKKLEAENYRLKRQFCFSYGKKSHTRSLDVSCTTPKRCGPASLSDEPIAFRSKSLSWPDGLSGRSCGIMNLPNASLSKCAQTFDQSDDTNMMLLVQQSLDNVDGAISRRSRSRTSHSVRVDIQSSAKSRVNLDLESRVNIEQQFEVIKDGYSYIQKDSELNLTEIDSETKANPISACDVQTEVTQENLNEKRKKPKFVLDDFGYLEMNHNAKAVQDNDKLIDHRQSDTNTDEPGDSFADEIHITHRELSGGHSSQEIPSTHVENENPTEKCLVRDQARSNCPEVCYGSSHYETIHCADIPPERPPLPPRRVSRSGSKTSINTATSIKAPGRSQSVAIISCRSDLSSGYMESRPSSLPLKPQNSFEIERSPNVTNRRTRLNYSSSVPTLKNDSSSPPSPKELRTVCESRSSNISEMKKDDALNRLFKDMRTTMEWDKTKKRLMHQSHMNTVEHIEKQLRVVVQEVYKTYQALGTESQSRQSTKEKVLQRVKDALTTEGPITKVVSDDFLIKCIDLVIITTPV